QPRVRGLPLERVRLASPFLLRTTTPALSEAAGRTVRELRRVGKRIVIGLDGDLWLVLHLMVAGRLHWKPAHAALKGRQNLAAFDFPPGSLTLTEAGSKRRASPHPAAPAPGVGPSRSAGSRELGRVLHFHGEPFAQYRQGSLYLLGFGLVGWI